MNPRVQVLWDRFFVRYDRAAVLAPWGKPCPVDILGVAEQLLRAHVQGDEAPIVRVPRMDRPNEEPLVGRFRVGSYVPDEEGNTPWLCLDVDGPGHSHAVADPTAAVLRIKDMFEKNGIPVFIEKSGSGAGWHLWVFFDRPVPAVKARQLALAPIPRDVPLVDGGFADPERNKGIEIFPKQARIAPEGFGNLVWLPWWSGAEEGANQFHALNGNGTLHPYLPESFTTIDEETVDRILAEIVRPTVPAPTTEPRPDDGHEDDTWQEWRRQALVALPLAQIYDKWLTGKSPRSGWLECRVPWSPTGDRNPSGGVADGTGTAERGSFHDFTSGETLSVFDFLIRTGRAKDFTSACRLLADLSGIPLPTTRRGALRSKDRAEMNSSGVRLCGMIPPGVEQNPVNVVCHEPETADIRLPEHQTDLGNTHRLVARHGHDLRYLPCWKKWLVWDGRHWRLDDAGAVMQRAKETIVHLYAEVAKAAADGDRHVLARWALRSEAENRLQAMINLARSEPGIPVNPDQLDSDIWLLNCANGTLDLRTGTLRPHSRNDLMTRVLPVAYDPDAPCPRWEAFLDRVLEGNRTLIDFVRRAVGYMLTGSMREHVLFILYGRGRNGKSTLLETLAALLGDYALQTPMETLMMTRGDRIPNDIARLKGARLVTAIEAEEGQRLREALIKQMTGGDRLPARFLHGEFFEFVPNFKLFLAVNHRPIIRGTDYAIWERIRLVPFNVTIPPEERDFELPPKLREELPGILHWAVEGCLTWFREGLGSCREVQGATSEYRSSMDVLGEFLEARGDLREGARCRTSELHRAYMDWCDENREKPLPQKGFAARLEERGLQKIKSSGVMTWMGIGLQNSPC